MPSRDAALFTTAKSPCSGKKPDEAFCGFMVLPAPSGPLHVAVVRMGPLPFDGVLGIAFFKSRRVFIDFDAGVLHLGPVVAR